MTVFAYECFADGDVRAFLEQECGIPLRSFHAYGQGEVVRAVFVDARAEIGMVDEDPLGAHHGLRDRATVLASGPSLEVRERGGRHLIVIKPELEECFLRSVKLVGYESRLPARARELRALLGVPHGARHARFRTELAELRRVSRERNVATLPTELEEAVRTVLVRADRR